MKTVWIITKLTHRVPAGSLMSVHSTIKKAIDAKDILSKKHPKDIFGIDMMKVDE